MKFSADRTEKKGPLGGAYYETYIKITLTPEEETIARKQGIMRARIFGSMINSDHPETREAFSLCGRLEITMEDLLNGITVKVGSGKELGRLGAFEDLIKQRCKNFKSNLEADQLFGSGGSKDEEEL